MERTAIPSPFVSSPWDGFRTGGDARNGPIAVGGDLSPQTVIGAYRIGLFPWPTSDARLARQLAREYGSDVRAGRIPMLVPGQRDALRLPWWSPDPRGIVTLRSLHISHSLARHLRRCGWTTTLNEDFHGVIRSCVRGEEGRWITEKMIEAFSTLHTLGFAHSVEVRDQDGNLAGGIYGVLTGGIFSAESMFHYLTNASKVALIDLLARLFEAGGRMIDTQTITDHLKTMGAFEMPRNEFLRELEEYRDQSVQLPLGEREVGRLARLK